MERHGYGNEYPCWSKREGELPTRGMSFWTSIPRDNPWVRSQPCAQTGVPRRVPAGARSSAAGCCGARWPRSLLRYVTAAEAAIARRSARSVRICQEPAPYGVGSAPGPQAADWEWGNRKCRATRGQFALARPESLLGSRQCRGHPPVAVVLQSGSVEQVETYGYFTPCFARSLIGKMGTHPRDARPGSSRLIMPASDPERSENRHTARPSSLIGEVMPPLKGDKVAKRHTFPRFTHHTQVPSGWRRSPHRADRRRTFAASRLLPKQAVCLSS